LLDPATRARIEGPVERAGLPTHSGVAPREIAQALTRDKKVEGDALWLVAVRGIGEVEMRLTPLAGVPGGARGPEGPGCPEGAGGPGLAALLD
jgi:hypothetical protein